jgi:hypothetical protein
MSRDMSAIQSTNGKSLGGTIDEKTLIVTLASTIGYESHDLTLNATLAAVSPNFSASTSPGADAPK